ncbi:Hint domain-containing protein [Mameliella sp.]|uniref:Hint domain-containing protein n=1 Tax=Mameliella sp. TaxID=1924940 RepID=UPI003BAA0041
MSTINLDDVYTDGSVIGLTVGSLLNPTTVLDFSSPVSPASITDANDTFEQTDDGITTFNGNTIDYIGHGTASVLGLLDPQPFVAFDSGGQTYFWFPEGKPALSAVTTTFDLTSTGDYAYCFADGTLIAPPEGERKVEDLSIGDKILTADGSETTVKWLGVQTLNGVLGEASRQMVRISAGALGDGLPHSDLTVTADHGMIIDGLVVNASALVNGSTIDFVPATELDARFKVYHVETESHEEIIANGAAAETFVDYAARKNFDNYEEYVALYDGVERLIPEMCKPRVSSSRMLPAQLRAKLGMTPPVTQFRKSA